jgi:large subunit ribosomal protein L1
MKKPAKRLQKAQANRELQTLDAALAAVCGGSGVKFNESVDVAVQLGVDTRKSDQSVRGAVSLPAGTGKDPRVAVVAAAEEDRAKAKEAGAEVVGFEELIAAIGKGELNFDVLIATPDSMRHLAPVAKTLGPRGLMPNPKTGTVAKDAAEATRKAKSGQAQYRADKAGIVHASVGKASFAAADIKRNIEALLDALKKAKPASSKGVYLRKLAVSATMGRSAVVDLSPYR